MRCGIWLIGARGSVATTVVAGAAAIKAGLAPPTGCVTAAAPFRDMSFPAFDDLIFGGHDMVPTPLPKRAEQLAEQGVFPHSLLDPIRGELAEADSEIRTGVRGDNAMDQAAAIKAVARDLTSFQ